MKRKTMVTLINIENLLKISKNIKEIKTVLCSDILKTLNLNKECFISDVTTVSSEIVELTRRQQKAFLYLKP